MSALLSVFKHRCILSGEEPFTDAFSVLHSFCPRPQFHDSLYEMGEARFLESQPSTLSVIKKSLSNHKLSAACRDDPSAP